MGEDTGQPLCHEFSPVTADSIAITAVYTVLLLWGMWVRVRQVYQGFRQPEKLLNPLFGNRQAINILTFRLVVVSLDLLVCGPLSLEYKSRLGTGAGGSRCCPRPFPWRHTSSAIRNRSAS